MSKDFIKDKVGLPEIMAARRQQKQLAYLTQSDIQDDVDAEFIDKILCGPSYKHEDQFINWVKAIFKQDNFKTFYKYLRFPLASSRLVQDKIRPHLERVFHAEDSYFRYTLNGDQIPAPEYLKEAQFNRHIFEALLFRFNDVLAHDLSDVNNPMRSLVSIDNIVALESKLSQIKKIAYTAQIVWEGVALDGYLFADDQQWIFYDKELKADPIVWSHDLGCCPADYVSDQPFSGREIVRSSVFSYVREELEEYVFLKTILKMSDPNGAIPIVTKLKTGIKDGNKNKQGDDGESSQTPMSSAGFLVGKKADNAKAYLQAGSVIEVPVMKKDDGSVDMDVVKNFLNFFRIPTESLEYVDRRCKEIEKSVITSVVGDYAEQNNEAAKNVLQVTKSYGAKQDKLRALADSLTTIRQSSDWKMMALAHGPDAPEADVFFGSDFFVETQEDLYLLFKESPNPIERSTILQRLARNRGRFNARRAGRDEILYKLMPFASDDDFQKAVDLQAVDAVTIQLQLRLSYWIGIFEAQYGDILTFWETLGDVEDSQKMVVINQLLIQIIKDYAREQENTEPNAE